MAKAVRQGGLVIGRLRGTLVATREAYLVLDVGGVGYEVAVTPRTVGELPPVGEEVVLHTHLHLREDGMALYGFTSESERQLFRMLITASGVGPKMALGVLGSSTADELRRIIVTEDVDSLTRVPGIGKRTAQKLILDLRPKLAEGDGDLVGSSSSPSQVREALESLGFGSAEIAEVLPSVDDSVPVEEQVRNALRMLGRR